MLADVGKCVISRGLKCPERVTAASTGLGLVPLSVFPSHQTAGFENGGRTELLGEVVKGTSLLCPSRKDSD